MSSIAELATQLRIVLASADAAREWIWAASQRAGEASQALVRVGSTQAEMATSIGVYAEALQELRKVDGIVDGAASAVMTYLHGLEGGESPQHPAATAPQSTAFELSEEQVEALRKQLPPDLSPKDEREPGSRQRKTHGRWVSESGKVHEETSGRDTKSAAAVRWFSNQGKRVPVVTRDIEVKLAVHMRENKIHHAELIINNIPCEDEYGCDALVPTILPRGYSLTVYGRSGYRKTYRGRAT